MPPPAGALQPPPPAIVNPLDHVNIVQPAPSPPPLAQAAAGFSNSMRSMAAATSSTHSSNPSRSVLTTRS